MSAPSDPLVTMSRSEQAQFVADTRQRVLAEVREVVETMRRQCDADSATTDWMADQILAKLDALIKD